MRKSSTINHSPLTSVKLGFTLIELLVVVGLIGIIGAIAVDIFGNVTRSYNKASIIAEVEQNGNTVLSQMTGEIRNARSIVNFSATNLSIISSTGQSVSYSFVAPTPTDNGYVARNTISLTDNAFTSGVNVTSLTFSVSTADPPVVAITISLSQPLGAGSRIDFQAGTTLQTSVSLRIYE